ncbi:MAG: hypothetical protein JXR20_10250 [Balneola sp.]
MKKWISGTVLFILVAIIAVGIFFPNLFEDQLKSELEKQVLIQTDSTYSVVLDELDISFWKRSISADSLTLMPSNESEAIKSVYANSIQIKGIQWWSLLFDQFISFKTILIEAPDIEIYSRPLSGNTFKQSSNSSSSTSELELSKFDFIVKNGTARLVEPSGRTEVMLEDFNLMATEVDIPQVLDGSRLPFLKELVLTGKGLTWRLDEQLYRVEVGEFSFNRTEKNALIKDIALIPVLPRYEFTKIKGYSTDRIDLDIDMIKFRDVNIDSLYIPRLSASSIEVEKGSLNVFKNKTIASKSTIGYRSLLGEHVQKIGVQIGIDSVLINNFNVSYTEHKEGAEEPGSVFFQDITGSILNVNTPGYPGFDEDTLIMSVSTRFMDVAKLDLNVRYPLFDENETHHVWGSLEEIDTKIVHSTLLHLAFVDVKSGFINSMEYDFMADDEGARGNLLLDYQDLELTFLSGDDTDDKNLGSRFKTLLANTIGLNKDNTDDISPKEIDYEWDKRKGVFGYWWRSLLSGIKNTIQ